MVCLLFSRFVITDVVLRRRIYVQVGQLATSCLLYRVDLTYRVIAREFQEKNVRFVVQVI